MQHSQYPTAPIRTDGMPPGIPYIVGNEAAERFSFYGMKAILVVFMTEYLMGPAGSLDPMAKPEAMFYYHLFSAGVYFFPFLGAILADALWGKYATIVSLSLVYCAGHVALALDETRVGLFLGLTLIALGAGGIKSCVSAHVGDQFGPWNSRLLERVFSWFYFAINLGAASSSLLTPLLLRYVGPGMAFGVPGILMALATLVFFLGRYRFAHIPPAGLGFLRDAFSREGLSVLLRLTLIYAFVTVFWSLFDQCGSSWVLQAKNMDRRWLGIEWTPSQIQAANPILIMLLIPLFSYVIYPAAGRLVRVTPLRKMSVGMFLAAASFAIIAGAEHLIEAGKTPSIVWQLLAYVVLTSGEILVSITGLEFSYTQAPRSMKSLVMGLWFLAVSSGNTLTAGVNYLIQNPDGTTKLDGPSYFWFFTAMMGGAAVLFVGVASAYRERTYLQEEET